MCVNARPAVKSTRLSTSATTGAAVDLGVPLLTSRRPARTATVSPATKQGSGTLSRLRLAQPASLCRSCSAQFGRALVCARRSARIAGATVWDLIAIGSRRVSIDAMRIAG